MKTNTGDFFPNFTFNMTNEDYQMVDILMNAVKAFARSTHQSVYIIDYFKQDFLYVSDDLAYWCGLTSEKIKEIGFRFYLDYIPEKEFQMLLEISKKVSDFFSEIPTNERLEYTVSYDFHLKYGRKSRLVNHQFTPIMLTKDGEIWLALCTISISARNTPGHIVMKKEGSKSFYEYSLDRHKWMIREGINLSETECDVLALSAQGYTMKDIANRLCKSIDTIKACKRALFSKLGVKNIAEALSFATNYKLFKVLSFPSSLHCKEE